MIPMAPRLILPFFRCSCCLIQSCKFRLAEIFPCMGML
uniref:Uncharacterized protein n=1 Tax=Arundo donax TaxID=35708 RepID=A0A0A8YID8_ARUDO